MRKEKIEDLDFNDFWLIRSYLSAEIDECKRMIMSCDYSKLIAAYEEDLEELEIVYKKINDILAI